MGNRQHTEFRLTDCLLGGLAGLSLSLFILILIIDLRVDLGLFIS